MSDVTRKIIYPTFVVLLIASVWALGWEKSYNDVIEHGMAPPATQDTWDYEQQFDAPLEVSSTADPAGDE